jgi:hypothetical protein
MKTRASHTSVLVLLVVAGLANLAWGQQEPKTAPDDGQRLPGPISCVVKIACDPALLPLTPESVLALVRSSPVAGEALKQAFEIPHPDPGLYQYQIEFKPLAGAMTPAPAAPSLPMGMMGGIGLQPAQMGGGMGGMGGFGDDGTGAPRPRVSAGSYGVKPANEPLPPMAGAPSGEPMMPGGVVGPSPRGGGVPQPVGQPAVFDIMLPAPRVSSISGLIEVWIEEAPPSRNEAFLRAICERLQQALNDLWEKERMSVRQQLSMSEEEQARAEKRLRDLQKHRHGLLEAGQVELTPEALMDRIRQLDDERQRMDMDLLGQQARLKSLQQQIQATGERILRESTDDAVIKPLQGKIEQFREQLALVQQQYEKGLTSQSEVQKVRIALSEGEIQLAEARRRVAQAGGGEVLGRLNEELAMQSVAGAETEARLKYLHEQIEKNRQLVGPADEYEMNILLEMPHAKRAYETSKLRVEELEQRIRTAVAPTVTVIGGATSKPAK